MTATSRYIKAWRKRTKEKLVACFGGACNRCGYGLCLDALEFHHKDARQKSFSIAEAITHPISWTKIVSEVRKCVLLCNRCHTELHAGLWALSEIAVESFRHVSSPKLHEKDEVSGQCPICGADVYLGAICCSRECAGRRSWRTSWPPDGDLLREVAARGKSAVADRLSVSETAVRKRLARIGRRLQPCG